MNRADDAGFTLIEVLIAVAWLSVMALALSETLIQAQRVLVQNGRWMRATQLAAEGMEQLRAGHVPDEVPPTSGFTRTSTNQAWGSHMGLHRVEVTVSWNDGGPRRYRLVTLMRREIGEASEPGARTAGPASAAARSK